MSARSRTRLTPYDFNNSIIFPLRSGPQSKGFVFRSAVFYSLIITVLLFVFGKWIFAPFVEFFNYMGALETQGTEPSSSEVMRMFSIMGKIILPIFLLSIVGWVIIVMNEAAFYRRVFRGENKPYPWRFGRDEILVLLSQMVYGGIVFGVMITFYAIFIGLVVLIGLGEQAGNSNGGLIAFAGILMFVGMIGMIVLIVFLSIRLSPIAPLSFVRNKIAFGEAWRVTKGRFWQVFASFIIVSVLASIINYVVEIIMMVGAFGSIGSFISELENMDAAEPNVIMEKFVEMVTQPTFLLFLAIVMFLYCLVQGGVRLLFNGVVANVVELYRQDLGEHEIDVFE